jgi:hypothetical protein
MQTASIVTDRERLLSRFLTFELSYEIVSYKKVFRPYNLGVAIPYGKRYYAWFSFYQDRDVCFLMELTREKKIGKIIISELHNFEQKLSLGTLFYGTLVDDRHFLIDDVFYYRGVSLKPNTLGEKLGVIQDFLENSRQEPDSAVIFSLPLMWFYKEGDEEIPATLLKSCAYTLHHVQYRSLCETVPYINKQKNSSEPENPLQTYSQQQSFKKSVAKPLLTKLDIRKPQYNNPTVFKVSADIQYDIYHLYAYGQNREDVYYDIAYIPNCKSSIFMNDLFRNIRENKNLDYIEESDDEDDFENTSPEKYVDLKKTLLLECVFHKKFKKWVPMKIVPSGTKYIPAYKL